jgi:hypothetical protein
MEAFRKKYFSRLTRFDLFTFCWFIIVFCAILFDLKYLERFGTHGFGDPYFYLFSLAVFYMAYFTAMGFKGVFITFKLIYSLINNKKFTADYFHCDGSAGLKKLIDFSFFTTKLFASGTLFIPILLDYIFYTQSQIVKAFLYTAIFIFMSAILLSFFLPIRKLICFNNEQKEIYLDKIVSRYKVLAMRSINANGSIEDELEALNLYNYITVIKNTAIYSITFDTVVQVTVAIAIPVIGLLSNMEEILSIFQKLFS